MKKFVLLFLFFACVIGCEKTTKSLGDEDLLIRDFFQSKEYLHSMPFIKNFGNPRLERVSIETVVVDQVEVKFLMIPIESNKIVKGYLQVVDLSRTENNLPNEDRYAMNYIDVGSFDLSTSSGDLKMFDLNYGNFLHSELRVEAGIVKDWTNFDMPENDFNKIKIKQNNLSKGALPCDSNGDNNLGFAECYKCFSDAIDENAFSKFICDIPIEGWITCFASKSVACVYLAAVY